ncbi:cyclic nucleotide-binding domain-containing protein [Actinoplanes sp. KI2]|uniref:Crp/Fnr family transcriptional regulator n=1 Tax=Actinoplanes sp. KI2 TaxID=2983315 RepID=UPI0021D5CBDC|nr:cyclic nucleotide-binding domain-containing protein [Actinoplanes sp. KI2]MCU7729513.1 cyclic nucleotide-binding domain-containing protein [Actinoplanes sp. KI2]
MLSVFDLLVMHPFVADLPAGWLHRIALHARPVHHVSGFRLFREDTPADRLWLVHSGDVAIDMCVPGRGDIVVEHLGAGSVVGWSWLLPPHRYRFGAKVADDIRAVEVDAAHVRSLIAEDAELGRELESRLLAVVADRLLAARNRLVELYVFPGDHGH